MRWWLCGIYADHSRGTRREESPRPFSCYALRSPRSEGHRSSSAGAAHHTGANLITIRVSSDVLSTIGAHAQREAPDECCGLLVGTRDLIDEAVPAGNLLADPSRYLIDPRDHIAVNRRLRGTPRAVVGAYHSHPRTAATPSPRDLGEAHYPEYVWLIVSLAGDVPDHRAYRIAEGKATAVDLVIER